MPVHKVRSNWESGDLIFHEDLVKTPATGYNVLTVGDDAVTVGDGTNDIDFKIFLGSTTEYVLFDVGNSRVDYGADDKGVDVRFFGETASSYMLWDMSVDKLIFDAADLAVGDNDKIILGDGSDVQLQWNATYLEGGPTTGLWALCPSHAQANFHGVAFEIFDDFMDPASATASDVQAFTETDDGGTGTNAFQDAVGGIYNVVTAGADNDHHAMSSVSEDFLFASGKKLWFEARFRLAEANTNESAWWFGLTDTLTTGGLQAEAAGPLASYDGALIWKDEATMEIDFETSNAGTQATGANIATFVTNTWTTVGFYFDGTVTTSTITPYVDGTGYTAQNITLAGLQEMHLVFGVKAGPSNGAETLEVDYVRCVQLR